MDKTNFEPIVPPKYGKRRKSPAKQVERRQELITWKLLAGWFRRKMAWRSSIENNFNRGGNGL